MKKTLVKGYEVDVERPPLKLVGEDGNAFAILGRAKKAMKEAGWSKDLQSEIMVDATDRDYNHLLQVMMAYFDTE